MDSWFEGSSSLINTIHQDLGAHHAEGEGVLVEGTAKDHMIRMSNQA
jgi:hypothetical protein